MSSLLKQAMSMVNSKGARLRFPSMDEYCRRSSRQDWLIGGGRPLAKHATVPLDLVSVITVCFNSAATIERTIRSVVEQSHPHVEYIVIDGGSRDGTVDVLRAWDEHIDFWVSEPDGGISDAFNKGVAASIGEFVMIVSSDDWLEQNYLQAAVRALSACDADYVYGDLLMHEADGHVVGRLAGDPGYADHLGRFRMPNINHPTFVYRRDVFAKYGLFDLSLRQSMDYEWALRVVKHGGRGRYFPQLVSHVGLGGVSDRAFVQSLAEVRAVSIAYGCPATIAWAQFMARLLKGHARRRIEKVLPKSISMALRRVVNRGFGDVAANATAAK